MEIFKKYKTILLITAIVVMAFIAYTFTFDNYKNDSLLTSDSNSESSDSTGVGIENDLLTLLLDVRSIKLNGSVFTNEVFKSLEDFGQDIVPEPVGRENPFAPVGTVYNNIPVIEE